MGLLYECSTAVGSAFFIPAIVLFIHHAHLQSVASESEFVSIFVVSVDPESKQALALDSVVDSFRAAGAEGMDKVKLPALLIWNRYGESGMRWG